MVWAALRAIPDVRYGAALVEDERLVGVYASDLEPHIVRALLVGRLPRFMVPDVLIRVAQMPLLPNGKVDRSRLPARDRFAASPRTAEEQALCLVWREILSTSTLGVDDDFFAIGGDSILAMRMVAKGRQAGLTFSVADVFRARTVRALVAVARTETIRAQIAIEPFALLSAKDRTFAFWGANDE